jgi:putative ABC transport system permease protein
MEKLFGIPMGPLATALAILLALVVAVVATFAVRNFVFFKLGVRNVPRRRARTALIVAGLMLGTTIIAAALSSGDTMSNTVRSTAVQMVGATDEVIATKGADVAIEPGEMHSTDTTDVQYFPEDTATSLTRDLRATGVVDGVAPAIIEPVAVQDMNTRQSNSRVMMFASTAAGMHGFSPVRIVDGETVTVADLQPGEVFLNKEAADDLNAIRGDVVRLFAGDHRRSARVREIVTFDGAMTDEGAALTTLHEAQDFLDRDGSVKYVLVSNTGGATSGAAHTSEVTKKMAPTLALLDLDMTPIKSDTLEYADELGNAFTTMFTIFGSFSIAAGILLIFLIFVMLAAERRGELGIARAVGTRRGHLVQMFIHEGLTYDLLAAAVGAALGIATAYGMVFILSSAFGAFGITITHDVRARSIVVAYALGVLLTFAVVAVSAWRVSRLNIVSAIRNLPEPPRGARRRHWVLGILAILFGLLAAMGGISGGSYLATMLGISLVIVGVVPVLRRVHVPDRAVYTVAGLALVGLWLLPFTWVRNVLGDDLQMDFSVFIVGGIVVVIGASWLVMNNADVLLGGVSFIGRWLRGLAPVLRMSIAYPLRNRFRTGVTLTMFTLVVFTLVVGSTTSGSFVSAFDNVRDFGGGWDVQATSAQVAPLGDVREAIYRAPGLRDQDFEAVSSMSMLPIDARQAGLHPGTFADYALRGVDRPFLVHNTFGFGSTARGFPNPWQAMLAHPSAGYAVIDAQIVPRRTNWNAGAAGMPDFGVTGFYVEDKHFDPFPVVVRDPQTGRSVRLTVIGVLKDFATSQMFGITTSQDAIRPVFGDRVVPTTYLFKLAPGVDAHAAANQLEAAFLANGLEAESLQKMLDDAVGTSWTMNRMIEGFMALGLLVGVAALGVISARAVVERRQQIGILRAIGFRRGAIQLSFLLESSFVALTAIVVGTILGLVIARNVVADAASSSTYSSVHLAVPWVNLTIVFVCVYAVALLTTLAPAIRASRIYPAEALRYE